LNHKVPGGFARNHQRQGLRLENRKSRGHFANRHISGSAGFFSPRGFPPQSLTGGAQGATLAKLPCVPTRCSMSRDAARGEGRGGDHSGVAWRALAMQGAPASARGTIVLDLSVQMRWRQRHHRRLAGAAPSMGSCGGATTSTTGGQTRGEKEEGRGQGGARAHTEPRGEDGLVGGGQRRWNSMINGDSRGVETATRCSIKEGPDSIRRAWRKRRARRSVWWRWRSEGVKESAGRRRFIAGQTLSVSFPF
jgi:hypothetical protein